MKHISRSSEKRKSRRHRINAVPVEAVIFDSAYIPDTVRPTRRRTAGLAAFGMLFVLALILAGSFVSAFHIRPQWMILTAGLLAICAFFTWFFLWRRLDGYRLLAGLLLIALYGGICFVLQNRIISGFYQTAELVVRVINQTYDGNLTVNGSGTELDITIFLLAVLFAVTAVLAAGVVRRQRVLPVLAILFPVLALTGIAGGTPGILWMYLILLGFIILLSASRSCLPFWKTALAAGLLAAIVSVPAWYLVRPLLDAPASDLSKPLQKAEARLMQSLYQILPQISGGRLNLSLEGVGGGVEDGTLGAIDGYFFTGVEALRVTSEQMPQETVYLKGYVGQEYTGTSYEIGSEDSFNNASSSWRTEGDTSLYIQNLPFLRMMYYENYGGSDDSDESGTSLDDSGADGTAEAVSAANASADTSGTAADSTASGELQTTSNTITVENLNANTKYTYIPYYSFINDNYLVYGGDSYVGGQTIQDDVFPCYWRSSYREAMEAYRDSEEEGGILDRVEESYRAYCTQHDLEVPEEGLERLKEECEAVAEEEKWNQKTSGAAQPLWARADEIEEIRLYVLKRLLSECEYELDVDALPEEEDFIEYFLYETKEGYSMHFAAAATMMFRMFGVPARYVVGYVAPKELFTLDENGTYTAILEDDNAHAWTEIYLPFLGWTPVEVTPGMESEVYGDLYMEETESESEAESEVSGAEEANDEEGGFRFAFRLPSWLKNNLETIMLAVQVLLLSGAVLYVSSRILRQRKHRLGLGADPAGRIRALYHSLYRVLVLSGMPEAYTIAHNRDTELLEYLLSCNPDLTQEDGERLQRLVLTTNYGFTAPESEDVLWMLEIYRGTWRSLKKRISMRKRLSYLFKG